MGSIMIFLANTGEWAKIGDKGITIKIKINEVVSIINFKLFNILE